MTGAIFETPWELRCNPHLEQARERAIEWMSDFGLLHDEASVEEFTSWRLAEVASFFYPDACAEDCALAAQMMGWYFLPFDDQLDGELGRDPARVDTIVSQLIAIVHMAAPGIGISPTVAAFADLWRRFTESASREFVTRLQFNWTSYFSSQLTEAIDRRSRYTYRDLDHYFLLRASSTCAYGQNDLAERWGGIELRPALWHHPVLAYMRQLGADVVALRNDSMSLRHEDIDGVHNAIFILEKANGVDRDTAVGMAGKIAQDKVTRLIDLEERCLPRLLQVLGTQDRRAIRSFTDTIHNWIVGDFAWEAMTARHLEHRKTPDWAKNLLTDREI